MLDPSDPQSTISPTDKGRTRKGRILASIDRIEKHADSIYVLEIIDDEFRKVSLLKLPTHLAIRHICQMLRVVLRNGEPPL